MRIIRVWSAHRIWKKYFGTASKVTKGLFQLLSIKDCTRFLRCQMPYHGKQIVLSIVACTAFLVTRGSTSSYTLSACSCVKVCTGKRLLAKPGWHVWWLERLRITWSSIYLAESQILKASPIMANDLPVTFSSPTIVCQQQSAVSFSPEIRQTPANFCTWATMRHVATRQDLMKRFWWTGDLHNPVVFDNLVLTRDFECNSSVQYLKWWWISLLGLASIQTWSLPIKEKGQPTDKSDACEQFSKSM